jgi:hypothetical protein
MATVKTVPQSSVAKGVITGKCPACKVDGIVLHDVRGLLICEKCSGKRFSNKVRKRIQEAYERQEDKRRHEAWVRRLELAKRGVGLFEKGKIPEALRAFRDYLAVLETRFGVSKGDLHIGLFDPKKDAGEILLLAGVYWDLAKIYDHMGGQVDELRKCLNKFIEFSIERPHMILASEAIRKYLGSGKANHGDDFKNAHAVLQSHLARCFIATAAFGAESPEVAVFRRFRDETLSRAAAGRAFISAYYRASPAVADFIDRVPLLATPVRAALRPLAALIAALYKY